MHRHSSVSCVPTANVFTSEYMNELKGTQVYPCAFHVNYFADGTGRDTFVQTDNGGFFKAYTPAHSPPVTSFF